MGRMNAPGVYRVGQYSWVAKPELIQDGSLVPRIRIAIDLYCLRKNCTQKELSAATKIPESRISEYVKGKRPISPSNLRRLCIELQLPPNELIGVVEHREIHYDELRTG